MRRLLTAAVEALFRVLFTYDCVGEENVPTEGPAVVAANHPSYLDPILLSLQVTRPIRFMAWDRLFRIPVLGALMRLFGAFPVDIRPGRGREAYARARALVEAGEVVGLFPEGQRSKTGWLEPRLREGAARLSWETGAPLVPATIAGAFRAWPHYQSLPRPARIRVRYHEPIDPAPFRARPEEEALPALLSELQRRVDRSLLPGVKADLRLRLLYTRPAPWPRPFEVVPALSAAVLVGWRTRGALAAALPLAYVAYLLLDAAVLRQSRLVKWIRNASAPAFLLAYAPVVLASLGLPRPPAGEALVAVLAGALFPYLYEHLGNTMDALRGLVAALVLEAGALALAPSPLGPHVALPLFAAAFAWERRTVFWRYAVPVLVADAAIVPLWLGGWSAALVPHALAGLLAWLFTRLVPWAAESPPPPSAADPLHGLAGPG